jgi:hypothetical protein
MLVLTSSESLPPGERDRISQAFGGAKVRDNYGASEFVAAGYDCGHGWLHVNADWVILEPVDDQYQPVPPGTTSHAVLLTNLANRVQPIIRYEMKPAAIALMMVGLIGPTFASLVCTRVIYGKGSTTDGLYYISFSMPVETGLLPVDIPQDFNWDAFSARYPDYLQETFAAINSADPAAFTPAAGDLHAFVESLTVGAP